MASHCVAVIPCLNEAGTVAAVVRGVLEYLPAVIVVDDGSDDETGVRAEAAGAEVLRHPVNRGKGAALQTGWAHARERGFQWALTLDGDGQHDPTDVPTLLACAGQTGATLIVGNRMGEAGAMPPLRRWVNRWMTARLSDLTGVRLLDSQCGFRLVHLPALGQVHVTADRFEIESELLLRWLAAGRQVAFAPVRVIYSPQASKIHPLADSWRWWRWWSRQRRACAPATQCDCRSRATP